MRALIFCLFLARAALAADPQPVTSYGLSLWDPLKYPETFTHFAYVNPHAPKGGTARFAETGTFDSLNPFIVKGNVAPGASSVFETLMTGSLDEPESLYGLVASRVTLPADRGWVEFELRPEARFHDGSPITADDVVFSLQTLRDKGNPTYRIQYAPIVSALALGPHRVRFTFKEKNQRDLPLLAAQIPILSKAYYAAHDFSQTTLQPPMASGPYTITQVDPGRAITFTRVKHYWGEHLPVNAGQNNFDAMHYDMYRDETVELQAFLNGDFDFREENIARVWATGYHGSAIDSGRIVRVRIPNKVPQGMQGFAFNLRRARFSDRRVREAIGLTLDFEWMNKALFYGAYKRAGHYFLNTPYEANGIPDESEKALLAPFAGQLPPGLLTQPFALPVTDGSGNDRPQLLRADRLLTEAGWVIRDGKRVNARTGEPLTLEFLFQSPVYEKVASPMRRNLKKLGIDATIRVVDASQYVKRLETFDFDLAMMIVDRAIFYPGAEQMTWFHSSQATQDGSNNYMGVQNPVIDALLARLIAARTEPELRPAARALDRLLLWEHYMIPNWYLGSWRIAYWNRFGRPADAPAYSLGLQTWWILPDAPRPH